MTLPSHLEGAGKLEDWWLVINAVRREIEAEGLGLVGDLLASACQLIEMEGER